MELDPSAAAQRLSWAVERLRSSAVFAAEAAYLERKKCAEDAYDWIVDRAITNACAETRLQAAARGCS